MHLRGLCCVFFFFFQAEDGIRDKLVTGVQTCALPISTFEFCQYGGPAFFQAIVVAIGKAERELALSVGKIGKRTMSPVANLSADWIAAANDNTPEFELALAVAGIYDGDGKIDSLRCNLEPVAVWR